MSTGIHTEEGGHPTPKKYVIIAAILAVITAVEVAVVYFNLATAFLITILIIMSAVKFTLLIRDPLLIHSTPVCQPSTEGGLSNSCPIYPSCRDRFPMPGPGNSDPPTKRRVPIKTSTGLLTLA